jgi:hypothetical protein
VKERPILFSAPMVRAILEGRKTQTRRMVKPQPNAVHAIHNDASIETNLIFRRGDQRIHCPYGKPGDRLWVRETWALTGGLADAKVSEFNIPEVSLKDNLIYFADAETYDVVTQSWRASIHIPRWASRILLEITSVRVEHLQDISQDDAKAEGLASISKDGNIFKYGIPDSDGQPGSDDFGWPWAEWRRDPRESYRKLFESINGAGSWDKNPLVWVIEFKRV